jgi:hypothetical protein
MRARSNNFTVDGSDNNDEDVGVRRQGFTALVPQSIESVREIPDRHQSVGCRAGTQQRVAGQRRQSVRNQSGPWRLYDYFNHDSLNARNFF